MTGRGTARTIQKLFADAGRFEQFGKIQIEIVCRLHPFDSDFGEVQFGIHQLGRRTDSGDVCRIFGTQILFGKCD